MASNDHLIAQIMQLHASISKLESLKPCKQVNSLFTHLVKLCTLPSSIDIESLPQEVQHMRESLINLCGDAETLLELEFSSFLKKVKILGHMWKYMKEGGFLLVRSAKGARAFLYPVIEERDMVNFEVLAMFHPTDDIINSVVLLRKPKA
uniref:Nicotianamine synthase n=1 Tax=Cajanus cajan TaxID=3821 RepID=A0A151SW39_CAJCA|nr:Nicotianamine synthase [Cajanus cajan]